LIESRCNVDLQLNDGCTALYIAAERGHSAVTKELIDASCNMDLPDEYGTTPLHIAAQKGHASVTEQLIEALCDIDLQDEDGDSRSTPRSVMGKLPSRSS
jgi:ankyrin repeat protein